jgi:ABC-type lipoprotein export system ATPase subunit
MGASGSGKSTLMNILGCLDHPTSGEYWLDEREVSRFNAKERARLRNRMIGFVFQNFNLLPRTTALDNVLMPLSYTKEKLTERQKRQRAKEMLEKVSLADRIYHQPSQLSGGEQQRVAIARSLINHPQLLLADEPTGNLDSHTSEEILVMFEKLNSIEGITIILVTHDQNVAHHNPRTIRMKDGLIEESVGAL